jgi:antirestriction protein ArdC
MEFVSNNNHSTNSAFPVSNGTASSIASTPASGSENRKPSAQQLVRENVRFLIQQLEAGHSEALTSYLNAMANFHNYSFGNILLIARQKPQASNVAGMYAWNQLGRRVKRGEKGIAILAPIVGKSRKKDEQSKSDKDDSKTISLLGFRRVYVWESQTEGVPLPKLERVTGDAGSNLERLREYVIGHGISLTYDESIAPALGTARGKEIRIFPGQPQAEEFSTLVHEVAHVLLRHSDRRSETTKTVRETEAEAIAFVVGKSIGLTTACASASYIQLYHGNAELLMESLEAVQHTAAVILAALKVTEPTTQATPEAQAEPLSGAA